MWMELITEIDSEFTFSEPATQEEIAAVETALGVALPNDLTALLRVSNGVGSELSPTIIFSTQEMLTRNQAAAGDTLLYIGEAVSGELYGYRLIAGAPARFGICAWDHADDSRACVAASLQEYVEARLHDGLEIPDLLDACTAAV